LRDRRIEPDEGDIQNQLY